MGCVSDSLCHWRGASRPPARRLARDRSIPTAGIGVHAAKRPAVRRLSHPVYSPRCFHPPGLWSWYLLGRPSFDSPSPELREMSGIGIPEIARLVNVVCATLGLIVLAPLFLAVAIAIVLNSGTPVFFRQPRVGRYGKMFLLLKFRSMRVHQDGHCITGADDVRITRVGRFLRHYKLDELPQLWNVLKGDLSLVGPRPEIASFVDLSDPVWQTI